MSGPKVVRIVTRDEAIATCRSQLARLDAALAEWERVGRRNDCLDEAAVAGMKARRNEIGTLLGRDRFLEIQKQVPAEVAFLRSDIESRLAASAAEKSVRRSRERQRGEAAAALLSALRASGKPIEASLERALALVAAGQTDTGAMAAGFHLLAVSESAVDEEAAHAQAARLKESGVGSSADFEEWLKTHASPPPDEAGARLEARVITLAQLDSQTDIPGWEVRIAQALAEPDRARRRLRLDSLEVELSRATSEAKMVMRSRDRLRLLLAEMSAAGFPHLVDYAAILESSTEAEALDRASARGEAELQAHQTAAAAAARRAAVLGGLAGLGYEVTEGMSTAWVNDGRVVLRKSAQPEYGVELAGNGQTNRLQLRAVAFTNGDVGPDPIRDADIETLWCGDVTRLSESLGETGAHFEIERALPIGAMPLKRIELGGAASPLSREHPRLQVRRLP